MYILTVSNIDTDWSSVSEHKIRRNACRQGAQALADNLMVSNNTTASLWFNSLLNKGEAGSGFYKATISKGN